MANFDTTDFDAIKISLASADQIRSWSYGEVKKPETINYRTLKPEKDGLFCEKTFGPAKDWECSCGKYKGIRFKGIVCERCGVEVTTSKVRRERMGHIELAAPVSHIWYFKSPMSFPLSRLLDLKNKDLEKVLYYASYIITNVDYEAREEDAAELKEELMADLEELDAECADEIRRLREQGELEGDEFDEVEPLSEAEIRAGIADLEEEYAEERQLRSEAYDKFMSLSKSDLISDETLFREMKRYYSLYFKGGMGAEAIRDLLNQIDLEDESMALRKVIADPSSTKQKKSRAVKRLEIVDAFLEGNNQPANMVLDVIPVIPPDLRPMVQLDGGRFAASDLNDLYRRVINRNNRLKRLLDLDAPDIIVNNEKRMLQESVDALFDNGRRGRPVTGRGGRPLKSLAEALKGKQGRFRQNLLGKRVDYSGRSVITVDPTLLLHQCGLPKDIALELFKPFVMRRMVERNVNNIETIKGAKNAIEARDKCVWDVLEEVIQDKVVLLNRAPTLHRLSIQAFSPVLVEGKAIHLHPLVCAPFNADFDGDQMSCHLPLSAQAQAEARVLMLSSNNLRSPASGKVLTVPSQDMVFGVYYLTTEKHGAEGEGKYFASFDDVLHAYDVRAQFDTQALINVRISSKDANYEANGRRYFRVMQGKNEFEDIDVTDGSSIFQTTCGRIIFNRNCLPWDYQYMNFKMVKGDIAALVNDCCDRYELAEVEPILDAIKFAGFHFATRAGLTVSVWDAVIPDEKEAMLEEAQNDVNQINDNYEMGILTERERHIEVVNAWTKVTNELGAKMLEGFSEDNPIYMMADSGSRGSKTQLRQLAGMRGLMADMSGETIDLPIKANFREGLKPLEYFISTYGARKGLVDTASHTSDSGYLTRRLVDVAQDVIVREADCGATEGCTYRLTDPETHEINLDVVGRCAVRDIINPETGEVILAKDEYIESKADIERLLAAGLKRVELRALLQCRTLHGVCQKCYGWDLSTRRPVNIGTAVGVIAAQSIGEPGTQLTMRTIHSGGVAGADDITQGLPTVSRMFDVVGNINEKILGREAELAPVSGKLLITPESTEYLMQIVDEDDETRILDERRIPVSVRFMPEIEDGCIVRAGTQITRGFVNFRKLRALTDIESTMHTFVESVKEVYSSQGVDLNDKHIEVISRQMLRRVEITRTGDSDYLLGEYIDRFEFADTVNKIMLEGGTPPEAEPVILGTLKVASSIDSWLSNASFIRTAGVLTDAAIRGNVDRLLDLKSNVIVGKKIPAGTGLEAYENVKINYNGQPITDTCSPFAKHLPEWAPEAIREVENKLPNELEWTDEDYSGIAFTKNGRTVAPEDRKLYLYDDLGVSQRWTNKFQEANIETVADLMNKTEAELLDIPGIGDKAIEELRAGLEKHDLLYILDPEEESADEDFQQLLSMVFSPDSGDDIMLGTAIPSTRSYDDGELLGVDTTTDDEDPKVINEDLDSLDDLLTAVVEQEEAAEEADMEE